MKAEKNIVIRDVRESDYPVITRMNKDNVEVLSPMDAERAKYLSALTELFRVVELDGSVAAFLIAMRDHVDYVNENYNWFSERYKSFLYVDRIVIDEPYRRIGIGRLMYEDVFSHATKIAVEAVTCEVDTEPYNEASLNFHSVMGFKEVGAQYVRNGSVKVSLMAKTL